MLMWNEAGDTDADHELSSIDQQMERIVAEAEAAAAAVRSNLDEAMRTREQILRSASTECDELRIQAEAFAAETRDEAERNRIRVEAMADDLLQEARAGAEEMRLQATADAAGTRARAEAIHALLSEQLPALSRLRDDLEPLLNGSDLPEARPAWQAPPAPAPLLPPAPQPERFLHPSAGHPVEAPAPGPVLHIVEPVAVPEEAVPVAAAVPSEAVVPAEAAIESEPVADVEADGNLAYGVDLG